VGHKSKVVLHQISAWVIRPQTLYIAISTTRNGKNRNMKIIFSIKEKKTFRRESKLNYRKMNKTSSKVRTTKIKK
jgi:hypothetical protein